MIKILFYIDTLVGGGAEKVLCNLVNHMDQKKFHITVQTLFREDATKYLAKGITYKYIYPQSSRYYQLRYRIEAALGCIYRLHMKSDYDIEVAYLECGPTKVIATSSNKKAKKIAWVHCDLVAGMNNPAEFVQQTSKWYQKFDRVVCVSENSKESFDKLFGSSVKSCVIYNVVDDEEIREKSREYFGLDFLREAPNVVTLGRLSAPKNHVRMIRAHKKLIDEGLNHHLWILGEGELRQQTEKLINELNVQTTVHLMGFQENPYPFMRAANILACSSNFEGFSTFVTEGLILGKPIITTDCSGMRELLGNSEYGLIVENSDEGFYKGMKEMLSLNEEQYGTLSNKSLERGKLFSAAERVRENENFFSELMGEKI